MDLSISISRVADEVGQPHAPVLQIRRDHNRAREKPCGAPLTKTVRHQQQAGRPVVNTMTENGHAGRNQRDHSGSPFPIRFNIRVSTCDTVGNFLSFRLRLCWRLWYLRRLIA